MLQLIPWVTTTQIIWIVVAVVALLIVLGLIAAMTNRKKNEQLAHDRHRAEEIRQDASRDQAGLRDAELEAEQRRIEAERAQLKQQEADRGLAQERAAQEDQLRRADRIDPDVDHRADDYRPTTPEATAATARGSGAAAAHDSDTVFDDRTEGSPAADEQVRPAAHGEGSVEDNLKYDDTYVDEAGVLRNRDGSEHVPDTGTTDGGIPRS